MKLSHRMKRAEHFRSHKRSPLSAYLREVIYGAVDGIITTFAVVAGFSGAALSGDTTSQLSFAVVLLFGLANLFADGVSMGLGNFLAVRSEQGLYRSLRVREKDSSEQNGSLEAHETVSALIEKGFSEADAKTLTSIYRKNEPYWIDFILNNELKIQNPMDENPLSTGFATFLAFITFGFIPLLPFVLLESIDPEIVFRISATGALIALVVLGIFKWKIVGTNAVKSILEVVIIGGMAATVAFYVGTLFAL
jgi:VIT1/CCC1 family predicted Fe2+/Mn2+ transporter